MDSSNRRCEHILGWIFSATDKPMASASVTSGTPASLSSVKAAYTPGATGVIATVGAGNLATGTWTAAGTPADGYVLKADSTATDQFVCFFCGQSTLSTGVGAPAGTWSSNVNSTGVAGWTITAASQTANAVYGWLLIH